MRLQTVHVLILKGAEGLEAKMLHLGTKLPIGLNRFTFYFLRTFKFTGKPVRDLTVVITPMTPTDLLGPCVGKKKFFQSFYIINLTGRRSQCAGIIHT